MSAKQPRGLFPLFFTEMWERFGFYTVQAILVLYMSKGLAYSDNQAYLLYGAFSSMLFITPVIGGYLAGRYMGFRRAITLGAIILTLGYAIMALPGSRSLFLGLSFVIVGNGFFKPNVSSIVGDLYEPGDSRREGGFTLFYMGINLGSLFPPLFAGTLVAAYTWGSGFLVASIGMIICLLVFSFGKRYFKSLGETPPRSVILGKKKWRFYGWLTLGILIVVGLLHFLFLYPKEATLVLIAASLVAMGSVLFFFTKEHPVQRNRLFACLILIVISIGFWAVYNQTYTSIMLFADRNMEKHLLGIPIDAEFTQFFNPFFIVVLSPLLSRFWIWLDEKKKNPSTPLKFTLGIFCMAVGFFILWGGIRFFSPTNEASIWWLICSYFFQTVGELFLSPIGLAMVTSLSPRHLVGLMMGVWFLTESAAFAIGGALAMLSDVPPDTSAAASLVIYDKAFLNYGLISLALAVLSAMLIPFLKRLIGVPSTPIPTPKR